MEDSQDGGGFPVAGTSLVLEPHQPQVEFFGTGNLEQLAELLKFPGVEAPRLGEQDALLALQFLPAAIENLELVHVASVTRAGLRGLRSQPPHRGDAPGLGMRPPVGDQLEGAMQREIRDHYRDLRQKLGLPASIALKWARERLALERRITELGIEWRERNGIETARWSQAGFDLVAVLDCDEDGWWIIGEDAYGRFSDQWQPSAIRHNGDPREYRWFIPADPRHGYEYYRRAIRYGRDWWYATITVKTFRHGVLLAEQTLGGLEYDLDRPSSERELIFSQVALELADQVVPQARAKLRELCADMPCVA